MIYLSNTIAIVYKLTRGYVKIEEGFNKLTLTQTQNIFYRRKTMYVQGNLSSC